MVPELRKDDALYLDFDGTLVAIAPEPSAVEVSDELRGLLDAASSRLDGALAIITGRPLGDLDRHLAPLRLAAAGEHGAELRTSPKGPSHFLAELPERVAEAARALAARLPGTLLELKSASLSLHYRRAPEHESAVIEGIGELTAALSGYRMVRGKMVVELRPEGLDKGYAIQRLAAGTPFVGRRPVFVGDDTTDEDGFRRINKMGGISVRVGEFPDTCAKYRMESIGDVHAWLKAFV